MTTAGLATVVCAAPAAAARADTGGSSSQQVGALRGPSAAQARMLAPATPTYFGFKTQTVHSPKGGSHSIWFGRMNYGGILVLCIDGELLAPSSSPSKPISRTSQVRLAGLLSRYLNSTDRVTVGALSYISRQLLDPGWSFDQKAFTTLRPADQAAIKARVRQLNAEAAAFSGSYKPVVTNTLGTPDVSGAVRSGTASLGLAAAGGALVPGVTFKARITGNAQFTLGLKHVGSTAARTGVNQTVFGQTKSAATLLPWAGTPQAKNGDPVTISGAFSGVPASAYYEYDSPRAGEQRVIGAAPTGTAAGTSPTVKLKVTTPKASTVVATQEWTAGAKIVDVLTTEGLNASTVDVTARALVAPKPADLGSCAQFGASQWATAVKDGTAKVVATAKVTGQPANADIKVPLSLSRDIPAGAWCGSIDEKVFTNGVHVMPMSNGQAPLSGTPLVATALGDPHEWGSMTVSAKPTPTATPTPSSSSTPAPTTSSTQPVIPTDQATHGMNGVGMAAGAGFGRSLFAVPDEVGCRAARRPRRPHRTASLQRAGILMPFAQLGISAEAHETHGLRLIWAEVERVAER
ncbi:hypothetical protein EFY87_03720 [Flexivirga caeni]|uniref:Uncharacterized protein n=1 Tax=Flexivirga caeni TaxID=2294115 RepID=A0A3M9MGX9_9MICO|nr:hypothetical protein EFY87_03720 [Flexivirga caeni]